MTNKPSLSDVARENNTKRVSKFANSIIPAAPEVTSEPEDKGEETAPSTAAQLTPEPVSAVEPVAQVSTPAIAVTQPEPTPVAKTARKRGGTLSMDDILGAKAPEEETFAKMTRIAEKHHELLREIAFKHRKPMNTILYNLLEALDQTYQREQQNHA